MTVSPRDPEILAINRAMLERGDWGLVTGDWENYSKVCSAEISCFEAESEGHGVEGHAFHRYNFDIVRQDQSEPSPVNVTMAQPHLHWLSDNAVVVSYTRLTQTIHNGEPITTRCCKTGTWPRNGGTGLQVHVHRSGRLGNEKNVPLWSDTLPLGREYIQKVDNKKATS